MMSVEVQLIGDSPHSKPESVPRNRAIPQQTRFVAGLP
jgi:hypothetical protein